MRKGISTQAAGRIRPGAKGMPLSLGMSKDGGIKEGNYLSSTGDDYVEKNIRGSTRGGAIEKKGGQMNT